MARYKSNLRPFSGRNLFEAVSLGKTEEVKNILNQEGYRIPAEDIGYSLTLAVQLGSKTLSEAIKLTRIFVHDSKIDNIRAARALMLAVEGNQPELCRVVLESGKISIPECYQALTQASALGQINVEEHGTKRRRVDGYMPSQRNRPVYDMLKTHLETLEERAKAALRDVAGAGTPTGRPASEP